MAASRSDQPMFDVALVAVFAALIAAFSVVPGITLPASPVPITLQTLAIGLTAMIIGPWRAFLSTSLYLLVGFAGLPVFAQGASGIGVLAKPSAGYLLSFPLYALAVGFLATWVMRRGLKWSAVGLTGAGLIGSFLLVHPLGIVGLIRALGIDLPAALGIDMLYWPGDLAKTVIAASIAVAVHKAFPSLLVQPTPTQPVTV